MIYRYIRNFLGLIFCVFALTILISNTKPSTASDGCVDYFVVFARGSGEDLHTNIDHQAFSQSIHQLFQKLPNYTYRYYQLGESSQFGTPYPAIGTEKPEIITGAIISGGMSFQFGRSVKTGIKELSALYRQTTKSCPKTRFILAGYSQGAMVISLAIRNFNPAKIVYFASFGDPKLYLPEGKGPNPKACKGQGLSVYRQNIPDCYVEHGLLGGLNPYIYSIYRHKVGAWCNVADFICGSNFDPFGFSDPTEEPTNDLFAHIFNGHVSYSRFDAYTEAAEVIYHKILNENTKQIRPKQLIHYYDPDTIDVDSHLKNLYSPQSSPPQRAFDKNDLIVIIPTISSDIGDARVLILLNQIFETAYNYHTLIHLYTYGYFSPDESNTTNFYPQDTQQNLPDHFRQGIKYIAEINAEHMDLMSWDQLIGYLLEHTKHIPNVNLPNLISSSFYDIVKLSKWDNNSNHLLFFITPIPSPDQSLQPVSSKIIKLIDQQNQQKSIIPFFYNNNPRLSPFFSQFYTISAQNIFDQQSQTDDIIQRIFYHSYPEQINRLIKPKFDSIDLNFSNNNFSLGSQPNVTIRSSHLVSSAPKIKLVGYNHTKPSPLHNNPFLWSVHQANQNREYRTKDSHLKLPNSSLYSSLIKISTPNNQTFQNQLHILPKTFKDPFHSQNAKTTIFPYRLIIIDDYIVGFTKHSHLVFTNLDPRKPHQIKSLKFSSLGRIINEETFTIQAKNKLIKPSQTRSKNLPQSVHNKNNQIRILKAPECGVKQRRLIQKPLYFTAYF